VLDVLIAAPAHRLDHLVHIVEAMGSVNVTRTSSGAEAIDRVGFRYEFASGCPDVVVVDGPLLDGVPVAGILRHAYPGVKVVVCTAAEPASDAMSPERRIQLAFAQVRSGAFKPYAAD
jgi:CheY-like chemotaxis protein